MTNFFMIFGPVFDRFWPQNEGGPKLKVSNVCGENGQIWENFPFFIFWGFLDPYKNSVFL